MKKPESNSAVDFNSIFKDMQEIQQGKPQSEERQSNVIDGKKIRSVATSSIVADPNQPRKNIDPDSQEIHELAESLKKYGFINFITVRESGPQEYTIVSGERRYLAAKMAGLDRIPVMVLAAEKEAKDYALMQLEENLQRKDLTPFEEAQAYERLNKEFGLQQKEIGELISKDKGYVSKMLRLTKIVKEIQQEMSEAEVSRNILWELATFPEEQQKAVWEKIKHNPIEPIFQREVKQYQNRKQREESSELFDADRVWEALQKVAQEDKNAILDYIPKEKIKKLLKKVSA